MTPKERNEIRELAAKKHKGNINAAICEWLGLSTEYKASGNKVPHGNAGAVYNIKDDQGRAGALRGIGRRGRSSTGREQG